MGSVNSVVVDVLEVSGGVAVLDVFSVDEVRGFFDGSFVVVVDVLEVVDGVDVLDFLSTDEVGGFFGGFFVGKLVTLTVKLISVKQDTSPWSDAPTVS